MRATPWEITGRSEDELTGVMMQISRVVARGLLRWFFAGLADPGAAGGEGLDFAGYAVKAVVWGEVAVAKER